MSFFQKDSNCLLAFDPAKGALVCNIAKSVGRGSKIGRRQKCCRSFLLGLDRMVTRAAVDLGEIYGVQIPRLTLGGLSCQEACDAVKLWTKCRPVLTAFSRLGRRERVGGRFAVKLVKKLMPKPCGRCFPSKVHEWADARQTGNNSDIPEAFFAVANQEVCKVFPSGWDKGYVDAIGRFAPPTSACTEATVANGGSRSVLDLDQYLERVIGEDDDDLCDLFWSQPVQYKEVFTSGKMRPLTVTPSHFNILRPLHKVIYDRLRRQKWCLVGPPEESSFRRAGFKFRSPILSGDYAGATDGLDLRLSRYILSAILDRCEYVPERVKERALLSLWPVVRLQAEDPPEKWIHVTRGQMMGSLLSFPLLCLYNRIATVMSLGRVPMLINGDDLVAETPDPEPWFNNLPLLSLVPERSKTGYSVSVAEINSTPFLVSGRRAKRADVARIRVLETRMETCVLGGDFASFTGSLQGAVRLRAESIFLRRKRNVIMKGLSSGLELSDMGFVGEQAIGALLSSGLFREAERFAQLFASTNSSPTLRTEIHLNGQAVPQLRQVTVYGDDDLSKQMIKRDRIYACGSLFGTSKVEYVRTAAYISRWWEEVNSCTPMQSGPVELTHQRSMLLYGGGAPLHPRPNTCRLFFGEPLPARRYRRRLIGRMAALCVPLSRISLHFWTLLPVLTRWGIRPAL